MSRLLTTTRLEAFSDGVIAVIMTIMVLELKPPVHEGFAALHELTPKLLVYLLSFLFTGVYWVNHDHLIARIEHVDQRVLYANLVFLFCLSLLPFFTGYVLDRRCDSFSATLYLLEMLLSGASFYWLRSAVLRRLKVSGAAEIADEATRRKHLLSLGLYVAMLPLSWYFPLTSMVALGLVMVAWIVPDMGTHHEACISDGQKALRPNPAHETPVER